MGLAVRVREGFSEEGEKGGEKVGWETGVGERGTGGVERLKDDQGLLVEGGRFGMEEGGKKGD